MRINSIHLKRFKRFSNSHITDFYAKFVSNATIIMASNSSGKAEDNDNLIRIPNGWKRMGDIKVGDIVIARDGTPTEVLGVFPQGKKQIYRVTFVDGRHIDCAGSHLWSVHKKFRPPQERMVVDTHTLMTLLLDNKFCYHIDTVTPELGTDKDFILHPYVVGALIGDGSLRYNTNSTIDTDKWICDKILKLLPQDVSDHFTGVQRNTAYQMRFTKNLSDKYLRILALEGKHAWDKFIPKEYLEGSYQQRLELLQGLMDTDGYVANPESQTPPARNNKKYICRNGSLEYSTASKELSQNIQTLVWSLGGICKVKEKWPTYTYNGERKVGRISYRMRIRLPRPGDAFTLPRKRARLSEDGSNIYTNVFKLKIQRIDVLPIKKECTCIYVDHPSHLYVTENYIVTHNTSLLRELSPTPGKGEHFDKGGVKELMLTHNGDEYILTSTFDKTVTHSFIKNGIELNINGLYQNQKELVEKHLGFTDIIEKLVYNRIAMCKSTLQERKDIFTKINSMNLELLDNTYRAAKKEVSDKKSQLKLLYGTKAELENKLIPQDTLSQYKHTKSKLEEASITLDKIIFGLNIHINRIRDLYKDLIDYSEQKVSMGQPIINVDKMLSKLDSIRKDLPKYSCIDRNNYALDKQKYRELLDSKNNEKRALSNQIANLSKEINEYDQHISNAKDKPKSNLEKDIKLIKKEMKKYDKLPEVGIPREQLSYYITLIEDIKTNLFIFRDSNCTMVDPKDIRESIDTQRNLHTQMLTIGNNLNNYKKSKEEYEKELMNIKLSSGIPDECSFNNCKLRENIKLRIDNLDNKIKDINTVITSSEQELKTITEKYNEVSKYVKPFIENDLLTRFDFIYNKLTNTLLSNLGYNKESLIEAINTQPIYIYNKCEEYIENSKNLYEYALLCERCKHLETELNALLKSSDVSISFIKEKKKEKDIELNKQLNYLTILDKDIERISKIYEIYNEYGALIETMSNLNNYFNKGKDALEVTNALKYYSKIATELSQMKLKVNEKLNDINQIVKIQDSYRDKLFNDNSKSIIKIEKEKEEFELIEKALSPTTGFVHRHMVKYLNGLIKNANTFLSQIWKFRLELQPLSYDDELTYKFKILIGDTLSGDITKMSDGQTEVVNLVWVLSILYQIKMLNKIPLYADEIGRTFDPVHRMQILQFLEMLLNSGTIEQMFMVNHYASLTGGFKDCDLICLDKTNMIDLPSTVNENVELIYS